MRKEIFCLFLFIILFVQVGAYDFCSDGEEGTLLKINSVNDLLDDNSDEWVWSLGDDVKVEVDVTTTKDEASEYAIEFLFLNGDGDEVDVVTNSDDLVYTFDLEADGTQEIPLSFTVDEDADEEEYKLYVKFYEVGNESGECVQDYRSVDVEGFTVCVDGRVAENNLEIDEIVDLKLDNENKWEWSPEDEIGINVTVSNGGYSGRSFDVELILFDEGGDEVSFAKTLSDLTESVSISEDEEEVVTFNFEISSDMDDGVYSLYAKVTDDSNESICTSLQAESEASKVDVEIDEGLGVLVSDVKGNVSIQEGTTGVYNVVVTNYGSSKQSQISVLAYSLLLGLREEKVIYDVSSGESRNVSFNVPFPSNSSSLGVVKLEFSTEYDYDSVKKYYASSSDESTDKKYSVTVLEKSLTVVDEPKTNVSAPVKVSTNSSSSEVVDSNSGLKILGWAILGVSIVALMVGLVYFLKIRRTVNSQFQNSVQYTSPNSVLAEYTQFSGH